MDNKESFGAYIQLKRKEAGLTQKSFAQKLFVSEAAVSKWERGLSYPDITLIKDICYALNISEHELLTSSEDTQARNYEKLANKYNKMRKVFIWAQYIIYGIAILTCFICNLAIDHKLSWFFIVITSILTAASLTLLPLLIEKNKGLITIAAFTFCTILLLFTCRMYTGGNWFLISAVSVIFGFSLIFSPYIMNNIGLPTFIEKRKISFYIVLNTVLLVLLLLTACLYTGGNWFLVASVSTVFGISVAFLPLVLTQAALPQPVCQHKTLIYFIINSLLLVLTVFTAISYSGSGNFLNYALPICLYCLSFAWIIMAIIRYAPINGFFKTAAVMFLSGAIVYTANPFFEYLFENKPLSFGYNFNFSVWDDAHFNSNINAICLFALLGLALIFAVTGVFVQLRKTYKQRK